MQTLLEYITSLQDQGLKSEDIFAKAQEFKKKNKKKEVKKDPPVKEGKTPVVTEKDTTVATATPIVSNLVNEVFSDSSFGSGPSPLTFTNPYNQSFDDLGKNIMDETFRGGLSFSEYNKQQEEYKKQLAAYNKAKKEAKDIVRRQQQGIDLLNSDDYDTQTVIRINAPKGKKIRGKDGIASSYVDLTFEEIQQKINEGKGGFARVKSVEEYVSSQPLAEYVTYVRGNKDGSGEVFEGVINVLPEVKVQKYDINSLSKELGINVWGVDQYNVQNLLYGLNSYANKNEGVSTAYDFNLTPEQYLENLDAGYNQTLYQRVADGEYLPGRDKVNLAINFTGEDVNQEGVDFVDVEKLFNYRKQVVSNEAENKFSTGNLQKDYDKISKIGENFLTDKEKNFKSLSRKEQNKIAQEEGYGEVLYFGDNIANLDLENVSEEEVELFTKSQELSETTELNVLKGSLIDSYYNVIGLAKEITSWDNAIPLEVDMNSARAKAWDGLNPYAISTGSTTMTDKVIAQMKKIAETGVIPKDAETISGSSPLVEAYNNALLDFKVVNRAIQLNRDPLTVERGVGGQEFIAGFKDMFGVSRDATDQESKERYLRLVEGSGFTFRPKSSTENDILYENIELDDETGRFFVKSNFMQDVGAGIPMLGEITFDMFLFGRGVRAAHTKAGNALIKLITNSKKLAKHPYVRKILTTGVKTQVGGINFAGGTLVNQLRTGKDIDLEEIRSSYNFGAALAFGHPLYDGIVKFINRGPIRNFLAKSTRDITKIGEYGLPKTIFRDVSAGFSGAVTYQFGTVATSGNFHEVSFRTTALETVKMVGLNFLMRGIPGVQMYLKQAQSDLIRINNSGKLKLESKKAAEDLGLIETSFFGKELPENPLQKLNEAFEKKLDEINKDKDSGKITEKEAEKRFNKAKKDYEMVDTQIAVNSAIEVIKSEKNSGNMPKESEFYIVSQKIKNGEKLNARDGEVLSYYGLDGVNMLYKQLGINKNAINDNALRSIILNESVINAQLNGKSFVLTPYGLTPLDPTEFVAPKGTPAYVNTREFLLEKQRLNSKVYELENLNKEKLSESEKLQNSETLKSTKEELKKYNKGGELYENIQNQITLAVTKAYEQDIQQVDPSAGKVVEAKTPEEFQKIYDESGFKAEDVKGKIAFTDKNGNKVINRDFALKQRNFTPVTHEIPHSILKDSFKDAQGNVTPEGIKMIDGVLDKLTPVQKKVLDQELASRYDVSGAKEKWYEENITVLAELIKRGEIQFSKSFGEGLAGLVPAFKKLLPNIEVNPETGKGIFDMLKAQDLSRVEIKETEKVKDQTAPENLELSASFSLSKNNSDTVNKLFEEKGKDASFEILELLRPTAVALARRFKNRPGYEEQLLVDEIMTGKRGMLDVINDYATKVAKGEKVGDLSLFLNNSFSTKTGFKRYIEIADRNLGKEFDQNLDDLAGLKDVAVEETTKEKEKVTATKRLPSEVKMKPEFVENLGIEVKEGQTPEQAIQEALKTQVLDSFKDVDIKKYKDLKTPRSLAEFYAKMLGIESEAGIKALMIPNRNFPAGEKAAATRAKQFILDNLQAIHSRINTPGFKQTKVGKALLTEKGDLKPGSLKTLRDIISGKNITVEGYDGKPIEFNPLENGKPVPLYRRSQPLKVVLSSYFKNNALEYLEGDAGQRANFRILRR